MTSCDRWGGGIKNLEQVNEMWRNRFVLLTLTLTLTLTLSLTLTLFSSYSYFIHSYDRLRHIILILAKNSHTKSVT